MNATENQQKIQEIRIAYNTSKITREEAKELAQPIIDAINTKAKELAKKHGVRYSAINFSSLMR